ncbi:hypothetical protein ACFS4T_08705 [Pseudomonas lini]
MSMTEPQMNLPLGRDKAIECNTELSKPIQIVDLFAGPGGLGEGFASSGNGTRFEIVVSAEMDPVARETLKLRAFYRLLKLKKPDRLCDYYDFFATAIVKRLSAIQAKPFGLRPKKRLGASPWGRRKVTKNSIRFSTTDSRIDLGCLSVALLVKPIQS